MAATAPPSETIQLGDRSSFVSEGDRAPKVGGSPGPTIAHFCKIGDFCYSLSLLLEIQFLATFGQYSFQQCSFGSLGDAEMTRKIMFERSTVSGEIELLQSPV